jgi:hypothetical protein
MAVALKGHPCTGLLFMAPFSASPSEDKASRRCVRQNTNLKLIDGLCVCIFRQRPSFRAENYAFDKVRNRISMRTAFHSNVCAVFRFAKFSKAFSFVYNLLTILYFLIVLRRPNLMHWYGRNLTGRQDPTTTFIIVAHILSLLYFLFKRFHRIVVSHS